MIKLLIIAVTKIQYSVYFKTLNTYLVDQIIAQFRTILKFIYSVDNENGDIPKDDSQIIDVFSIMILEFLEKYNPIRNYLEQCIIGNREINYDEEKSLYYEEHYNDYSNYARTIDKVKEFPSGELKGKVFNSIESYLRKNKYKPNIFKDRFFYGLMNDYRKICWFDSEIKFDYDFGDFTYSDVISFCASLKLIADYYSVIILRDSYFSIEYNTLVCGISRLSDLEESKVEILLDYQTYDFNYQKDKLTLIQSLILINDKIYFYPMSITIGLLPVKMYRLIYDYSKSKYIKDISIIAKKKEEQMTEQICKTLKKYDVSIKTNYKITKDKRTLAEYDMIVFDNLTNDLYICEFKWHFVADGEEEHKFIDDLLKAEVEHRFAKDKFIIDNPQVISDELFGGKKVNEVKEILISQNFGGNTEHKMTVIDFETLQWSADWHDSFRELMDYFFKKEYLNSIPVDSKQVEVKIEGYKFKYYRISIKMTSY